MHDLLEIKDSESRVDHHEILKGINLTVNPGEVHSIMGRTVPARAAGAGAGAS